MFICISEREGGREGEREYKNREREREREGEGGGKEGRGRGKSKRVDIRRRLNQDGHEIFAWNID